MKFSEQAFNESVSLILEHIMDQDFIRQLSTGELNPDIFYYYIQQDDAYLKDFARCYAVLATKISDNYISNFLHYAKECLTHEHQAIHNYFIRKHRFSQKLPPIVAGMGYINYLFKTCMFEPVEIGVAAIIPCCWLYCLIGKTIVDRYDITDNPYQHWIKIYSGNQFDSILNNMIEILDNLAQNTTESVREKMFEAFHISCCMEYNFFNDIYHKREIDQFLHNDKCLA